MVTGSSLTILDTKIESFEMSNDFSLLEHPEETKIKVDIETAFSDVSKEDRTIIKLV